MSCTQYTYPDLVELARMESDDSEYVRAFEGHIMNCPDCLELFSKANDEVISEERNEEDPDEEPDGEDGDEDGEGDSSDTDELEEP